MSPVLGFSSNLETTFHRALALAADDLQPLATIEHLLLSLAEDIDARAMMVACGVDIGALRQNLKNFITTELPKSAPADGESPKPTAGFQRIIQRAVIQVQASGREDLTGADILLAVFYESPEETSRFLEAQGMTRFDAVRYLAHGISKNASVRHEKPVYGEKTGGQYKVLLLNDDYTPMEFVVDLLETVFGKTNQDAMATMMEIHEKGTGLCGVYPLKAAETKVTEAMVLAIEGGHPLQCTMEPA